MTGHVHAWAPIPLEFARYECVCGATGYRSRDGIVEHKQKLERTAEVTVRGRLHGDGEVLPYRYHDTGVRNHK